MKIVIVLKHWFKGGGFFSGLDTALQIKINLIKYLMPKSKKREYIKVIDEQFIVPYDKGEGVVKFEAWEYENKIVKYNMFYINKDIYPHDNGRVMGYDNSHNFHHKHYFGKITELDGFTSYQDLVQRFKDDIREFVKW